MLNRSFVGRRRWLVSAAGAVVLAALVTGSVIAASSAVPVNTAVPTIKGGTQVGKDLTGSNGTWTGAGISYTYRWLRCDKDGANCVPIAGATKNKFKLTSAELGSTIRFEVTAASGADKAVAVSKQSALVAAGAAPANTALPAITGTATAGSTLTGSNGVWTGDQPITYTYQWQRCDAKGAACQNIPGATKTTYTVTTFEGGLTIRFKVTAKNKKGNGSASSLQTAVVGAAGGGGGKAVDVKEVPVGERLIVTSVTFVPKIVRSRTKPIAVTIVVKDTRGNLVRGALVFIRSTPLLTSTPVAQATGANGVVTYAIKPKASFPLRNGYNVQFFVKAYRSGDPVLSGVSGSRLVQVPTGR